MSTTGVAGAATSAAASAVARALLQADVTLVGADGAMGGRAAGAAAGGGGGGDGGVSVGAVFILTLLMAAASGLGALPFFFVGRLSPKLAGVANALACGVMLAASFDLVHEGEPYGAGYVILGVCVGATFIALMQHALHDCEDVRFAALEGADARKTILMVGIMTAHSFGEGSGVGVSFSGTKGWAQGQLVTLAIGAHNIPEGMAVATVLAARGIPAWKCAAWSVVTSLPQPLLAVPAFMFVEAFQALLPFGMGFAAGCMIWIVVAELLPDALQAGRRGMDGGRDFHFFFQRPRTVCISFIIMHLCCNFNFCFHLHFAFYLIVAGRCRRRRRCHGVPRR